MIVSELIAELQKLPQHIPVVYPRFGKYSLLHTEELTIRQLEELTPDGCIYPTYSPNAFLVPYLVLVG